MPLQYLKIKYMSKSISYGNLILIMKNDVMYQYMCVHKYTYIFEDSVNNEFF